MKLLSRKKLPASRTNIVKNDCPSHCDKKHCDECQFEDKNSKSIPIITTNTISPEVYGREMFY